MTSQRESFAEFYVGYLAEHRHPANRVLHLFAKVAMVGALGVAVAERSVLALLAAPMLGVMPCWLGHWLFERNRPTAWSRPSASLLGPLIAAVMGSAAPRRSRPGRPYYSLLADLRMCRDMLRGRRRVLRAAGE